MNNLPIFIELTFILISASGAKFNCPKYISFLFRKLINGLYFLKKMEREVL